MTDHVIVNPDDKDYSTRTFAVSFASILPYDIVYAANGQEALDIYADYSQEQGHIGLFLDQDEIDDEDEVCFLGNEGWPVPAHEIYLRELPR